jgi:hypothetical protein
MKRYLAVFPVVLIYMCIPSVYGEPDLPASEKDPAKKITFDISAINKAGLSGPSGGLVAVSYEFCIPAKQVYVDEVQTIDPTVVIYKGSSGRVGCTAEEHLCMGHTHQENFKDVLSRLAGLAYIKRIDRCFWE